MDYEMRRRAEVPAFGSWEYTTDEFPFTQRFESARQPAAGLLHYHHAYDHHHAYASYHHHHHHHHDHHDDEQDLYVAGDLYQNDVVTPAVILVPRRRKKGDQNGKEKGSDTMKEPTSPLQTTTTKAKAIDEDLYKISPHLLHSHHSKRKRGFGLFSCCLIPDYA